MNFTISEEQIEKFLKWSKDLPRSRAVDGAQFTWHFTSGSIGTVVKVTCGITGKELDLSDYENW